MIENVEILVKLAMPALTLAKIEKVENIRMLVVIEILVKLKVLDKTTMLVSVLSLVLETTSVNASSAKKC